MVLSFVSRDSDDFRLIERIADRAVLFEREHNRSGAARRGAKLHHQMNVSAVHASGNPLRLQDLLDADDFNFAHDVFGIDRHLDRDTGELQNFFSPRFSAPEHTPA
jgi:hypothetical protein